MQGEFTGFGAKGMPLSAYYVANIKSFESGKSLFTDFILFHVQLHAALSVLKLNKSSLTE